jgi:apolipoprotein D and lipocalin family protein
MKFISIVVLLICSIINPVFSYDKTVDYVDIERFMGDWYVVAGRFSPLEKDVYNAVESYKWNEKSGRIDIGFNYNKGSLTGPVKSIPQKGWVFNTQTNAHWKVSPLWPFKFDYLIIALDLDYEWTVIGVPSEKYLWIMTRHPHMPKDKIDAIVEELNSKNYNTKNLVYVQHNPIN